MAELTVEQKAAFVLAGRRILTSWAIHSRQWAEWATVFEQHGGAAALGNDAGLMVAICNSLQVDFLTTDRKATIALLRTDYTGEG